MTHFGDSLPDPWLFDGRYYGITTLASVAEPQGYSYELDDLGPAPGRGTVITAFWNDLSGELTFRVHTESPLPFRLVEQFLEVVSAEVSEGSHDGDWRPNPQAWG